jgi:hypothetical protein
VKNLVIERIGLLYYGVLSVVESLWNLLAYLLFLDCFTKNLILDISIPWYFNYTNKFQKRGFLENLKAEYPQEQE